MQQKFTIKGVLKESYAIMKPQLWSVIGRFLIVMVIFGFISAGAGNNFLVSLIASTFSGIAFTIFALQYAEGGKVTLESFMKELSFHKFAYYFLITMLAGLIIVGGFILLIIPGIILIVQLSLIKYIALREDLGVRNSLRRSRTLTKGHGWKIFWFGIISFLINILGLICLVVGMFFTIPLTMIAFALIYKKLSAVQEELPLVEAEAVTV